MNAHVAALELKPSDKVLDLGCGNGRLYKLIEKFTHDYTGLDISDELIKIAKKFYPKLPFVVGDALATPFKDSEFDAIISVATLHHIPSKIKRNAALKEIFRITKPGGRVLLTVWYFWNKPRYVRGLIKVLPDIISGKSELDPGDFMMTWKNSSGKIITRRYFHAWTKREMKKSLEITGFTNIEFENNIDRNLVVIARKPEK